MSQALLIPGIGRLNLQRLLFGANEVGGIWDWSDRSTMFQDLAGTQPITASGQTVALHLDKSKGLVLGPELVTNGSFTTDTDWTKGTGWTISGGTASNTTPATASVLVQSSILTPGKWYRVSVDLISTNGLGVLSVYAGSTASPPAFPFLLDLTPVAGTKTGVFLASSGQTSLAIRKSFDFQGTIDNISVRELPGNHRFQANLSNRPQYIEDETGHYGLYDGVDDWDETNAVDFTGTDKMTVWWGGRRIGNANIGLILQLSANSEANNGAFGIWSPQSGGADGVTFHNRGTTNRYALTASSFINVNNVICSIGDISGDISRLRVNGQQVANVTTDLGTGNYGNYKLYFGRRGGATIPANIREYMAIIRGAQTPINIIERVEREVRRKIKGLTW